MINMSAMSAVHSLYMERQRQYELGWTPDHDDANHCYSELAQAAGVYALLAAGFDQNEVAPFWPWNRDLSSGAIKFESPLRALEKAGALIVAEIERLRRLENAAGEFRRVFAAELVATHGWAMAAADQYAAAVYVEYYVQNGWTVEQAIAAETCEEA